MTNKGTFLLLRAYVGVSFAVVGANAYAHATPSDEAVWFFLAALLSIPLLLVGIVLLIVHAAHESARVRRAKLAATASSTADDSPADTEPASNAGALAGWLIGGSASLLASAGIAYGVNQKTDVPFWAVMCVTMSIQAAIVHVLRKAFAPQALRAPPVLAHDSTLSRARDAAPTKKPSNVMLWLSLVLLAFGLIAALSPYYLMQRKEKYAKEAQEARIEQASQDLMETPRPSSSPPMRVENAQRMQCNFYGEFKVVKRGKSYRFDLRADGSFTSIDEISRERRTGQWTFSSAPNKDGDANHLVFTYDRGLPATESEFVSLARSERLITQNTAGIYVYDLDARRVNVECKHSVRAREYPKPMGS